ncbi:hypothetical protein CORC01_05541 [Colletotrichum orchidophilum]|uniref:Uncharacterized protein n=1 Tax=Colletotrichum orchidophilum TaxID=1209926 RepID=A0A1G4BD11_9PEZI|nr:uncharacterized protein CORC01_05541 [Colletotrichum orchidophilum]OHE99260.1 hypothetical protein CORC01_05541 [Colletotrichum orchidophilum]
MGNCECNFEIAEKILDTVTEGLEKLDSIICAAMLESFNTILQVGINAIPGDVGIRAAVQRAKTFVENGLDAVSLFGNWVGKACGVPDWDFDLLAGFKPLTNAPDSLGASKGCLKKGKSKRKRIESKPDPSPTPGQYSSMEKTFPRGTGPQTPTRSASITASVCRIAKLINPDVKPRKLSEREIHNEICRS